MSELEVVRAAVTKVDFGVRGDPRRILKILLDVHCFFAERDLAQFEPAESDPEPWREREGLVAWPEGVVERGVAIIKPHRHFPDYTTLKAFVDELTDFEHLLLPWLTIVLPWADQLWGAGVSNVFTTDPDSLRRYAVGGLGLPYFSCRPNHPQGRVADRGIGSCRVEGTGIWREDMGLLVGCKEGTLGLRSWTGA